MRVLSDVMVQIYSENSNDETGAAHESAIDIRCDAGTYRDFRRYGRYAHDMTHVRYVALLRGINVGGNNIIRMADLKSCFEEMGFTDVQTYIQSGNVIFSATENNAEKLTLRIEKTLTERFAYASRIVILSAAQMRQVLKQAPAGFGAEPQAYRYDVIFVKEPLTTLQAMNAIETKPGVDTVHRGTHALYFSRLIAKATQSHLSKIVALPLYKNTTVRNWNTTVKLLAMMTQ
jgi:uncharacterized protein (DUF1697 family)